MVNRKRVQRYMREMGIWGLAPGPQTSTRHPQHPVYPYLLKGVTPAYPNPVWGIDVTDIRLVHGWLYLVAIMDWYSRFVVAWELSETLELPFVLTAAERALAIATPTIWNHDQGSHQPPIHGLVVGQGSANQHGQSRAGVGQCVYGTAVAQCEV